MAVSRWTSAIALFSVLVVLRAASAQAPPSTETLVLSIRTIGKAVAVCKDAYDFTAPGSKAPIAETILRSEDYARDLKSLGFATRFTDGFSAHPESISGKGLVFLLSTADDLSVGAGSTRFEALKAAILSKDAAAQRAMLALSDRLATCQRALFDAGDDYVSLVANYVDSEDTAATHSTH